MTQYELMQLRVWLFTVASFRKRIAEHNRVTQ